MKNEPPKIAQPAAYDAEGRPLYYQPTAEQRNPYPPTVVTSKPEAYDGHNFDPRLRTQHAAESDIVHVTRDIEPTVPDVSAELQQKHDESVRLYPFLNLSEGEYVVLRITRHPIGLLIPVFFTVIAVVLLSAFMFLIPDFYATMEPSAVSDSLLPGEGFLVTVLLLLMVASILLGAASVWIYQKNQFFLTNESVIQEIQHSLFSHHEQTVSLGSIEDASYRRKGILQHVFNYGTMRLSTEGEETTYRFSFVEKPKEQISIVSNAVEAFKNGRPVSD